MVAIIVATVQRTVAYPTLGLECRSERAPAVRAASEAGLQAEREKREDRKLAQEFGVVPFWDFLNQLWGGEIIS